MVHGYGHPDQRQEELVPPPIGPRPRAETQPAALRLQRRIRASRSGEAAPVLQGIAETDETYVGGKPRKGSSPKSPATNTPPEFYEAEASVKLRSLAL
ncbi:MAG: hypothetical protein M2R46_05325 [Verrucomicrobia subdivision 3 bacterium]|nr:hypothetical protein [Limisphaerales bacterium]